MGIQNFIDMNIDDLLELQKELKKINDYKTTIKDNDDDIELFQENISFFRDISEDIEYKFNELYEQE